MSIQTFDKLLGQVVTSIGGAAGGDTLTFHAENGTHRFEHHQSCCESVWMEDVCGDLGDLIGSPILEAEEVSSEGAPKVNAEDYQWTFYRFSTVKGTVTVRWLGTSNGYYGMGVSYAHEPPPAAPAPPGDTNEDGFYTPKGRR